MCTGRVNERIIEGSFVVGMVERKTRYAMMARLHRMEHITGINGGRGAHIAGIPSMIGSSLVIKIPPCIG